MDVISLIINRNPTSSSQLTANVHSALHRHLQLSPQSTTFQIIAILATHFCSSVCLHGISVFPVYFSMFVFVHAKWPWLKIILPFTFGHKITGSPCVIYCTLLLQMALLQQRVLTYFGLCCLHWCIAYVQLSFDTFYPSHLTRDAR